MGTLEEKTCTKCLKTKPITEFHLRSKSQPYPKSACKECHRERARRYWKEAEYCKETQRDRNLRRSFGITLEDYNRMLKQQEGCCAICKKHHTEFLKNLAVDHCHNSGKIRGLLCMYCNTALGKFNDNTELMEAAVKYIKEDKDG